MSDTPPSPWVSLETLWHLREADRRLDEERKRFHDERDRRYSDLATEREKRLQAAEENARAWRANANEWRSAMTDREKRFVTWPGVFALVAALAAIISTVILLKG